ncbi:MAG: hypothetical protein M3Q64_02440, partial [bacterium]|nr:hypothetical protein [bacterium]
MFGGPWALLAIVPILFIRRVKIPFVFEIAGTAVIALGLVWLLSYWLIPLMFLCGICSGLIITAYKWLRPRSTRSGTLDKDVIWVRMAWTDIAITYSIALLGGLIIYDGVSSPAVSQAEKPCENTSIQIRTEIYFSYRTNEFCEPIDVTIVHGGRDETSFEIPTLVSIHYLDQKVQKIEQSIDGNKTIMKHFRTKDDKIALLLTNQFYNHLFLEDNKKNEELKLQKQEFAERRRQYIRDLVKESALYPTYA